MGQYLQAAIKGSNFLVAALELRGMQLLGKQDGLVKNLLTN